MYTPCSVWRCRSPRPGLLHVSDVRSVLFAVQVPSVSPSFSACIQTKVALQFSNYTFKQEMVETIFIRNCIHNLGTTISARY